MRFLNEKNINMSVKLHANFMPEIDMDKPETVKLVQSLKRYVTNDKLSEELNMLCCDIRSIDIHNYRCTKIGTLPLNGMESYEKVFLIGLAAKYTGETVYLQHDFEELSIKDKRIFYKKFMNYLNIAIICKSEEEISFYKSIL